MTNEQRRVINVATLVVARIGCFSNTPWADVYIAKEAHVKIQGWEVESTWLVPKYKQTGFGPCEGPHQARGWSAQGFLM